MEIQALVQVKEPGYEAIVADMLDTGGDSFPIVTLLTGTVQGSPT